MPTEEDIRSLTEVLQTPPHTSSEEGKLQTPAGTAFKAVQSRKIIVIKRNPNLTNISKIEGEVPVSSIRQVPMERELVNIESNVQLSKKMCMEDNQRKMKPFRPEWLRMEIFKDWLAPDPDNMCKARCIACNTALNAGKSELEKHAVGAKHTNNLDALKQSLVMQQMFTNANADGACFIVNLYSDKALLIVKAICLEVETCLAGSGKCCDVHIARGIHLVKSITVALQC
uniref:Uncharacterized protein n=1 Tax=Timema genevievae TaxID=629358 RepID=A0A7R9PIL2_TIMGE|nr:unnamed protein product [Timema genevievae]